MNARVLDVVPLLVLYIPSLCMALTCLQCTDVPVPRDCRKVKTCGSHEVCFIDEYVIASGHIRYRVGCRDSRFCISSGRRSADESRINTDNHTVLTDHNILRKSPNGDMTQSNNDVMVRSSGNVKLCESCCNTDLCNNGGCAASGYVPRHGRGPICYTCAQQRTPGSCDSISVCGQNSICKIKLDAHLTTGDVFYSTKCEDPQVCHQDAVFQNMIVGRKRLTEEVNTSTHKCIVKCCDVDLCNGQCGTGSVLGTSGSGSSGNTDPCISNPCVYGSCSVYQGNYACTCRNGATGRNCDILHSPCDSNPCVHGSCHSSGISYQCHCNSGYTGTNCDHAVDYCASSPCGPGDCHISGYTFKCTCYPGWTGTRCHQYIGTVSHNCATGWLKHGSSCYLFKKEKQSWTSAKSLCSSQGAYLAEVNDGTEQHFLVQEGPVAHKGDWWIGGVHNNGRWQWDHSRHDISGGYWDSHFPRSHGGACIELHKVSSGAWRNEDSCSHENYYVCEKAE